VSSGLKVRLLIAKFFRDGANKGRSQVSPVQKFPQDNITAPVEAQNGRTKSP